MRNPTQTASTLLLLLAAGCSSYSVLHRGSDYAGSCDDATVDCCTNVHSAWATNQAELDAAIADQAGFAGLPDADVAVPASLFDTRAALVLWTDSCPGSDARLRVRSFDAQPDDVSVDLLVALPGIDQEIEGIRPVIVLDTDRDHAGKPVSATAQYP